MWDAETHSDGKPGDNRPPDKRSRRLLAEPTRLRLLSLVAAHQDSEECICNLTELVGVSQPTVSHHMKVLVDAGLLEREQRGKWAYYRIVPGALDALAGMLARASRHRQ